MNKIDIIKSENKIKEFLKLCGVYEMLKTQNIFIGGSVPMLCLSEKTDANYLIANVGDIDLYTNEVSKVVRHLSINFDIQDVIKKGLNYTFKIGGKDLDMEYQLITSGFDNFEEEVLNDYDCDLVTVGYDCKNEKFIIHQRFKDGLDNGCFEVILEKTYGSRLEKLGLRSIFHFGCSLLIKSSGGRVGSYRPYLIGEERKDNLLDAKQMPPYIQVYSKKFRCMLCKSIQDNLVCDTCKFSKIDLFQLNFKEGENKKLIVFGGMNGLGKIIADVAQEDYNMKVSRTTRNSNKDCLEFDLKDKDNKYLFEHLNSIKFDYDYIILNCYQTLEGNHDIWENDIFNFDIELMEQRFDVNCIGYMNLIKNLLHLRKTYGIKKRMKIVFMDAAESKYEDKVLKDGKHIELNTVKSATKQIFYSNGELFDTLNIEVICYDPGWLSYHGITTMTHTFYEPTEERNKHLIPPKLSAYALLNHLLKNNEPHTCIYDTSVYKLLN